MENEHIDVELFKLPATLNNYKGMSHRSMRITFDTQENLTDEQIGKIAQAHEKLGHLLFFPDTSKESDMLEIVKNLPVIIRDKEEISIFKRLDSTLYVLWKQKYSDKYQSFNDYKTAQIELIINKYKEELIR